MAVLDIEYGREITEGQDPDSCFRQIKEMEMVLQNSSYGHEYAMLELAEAENPLQQEELHQKIEEYKRAYFQARRFLSENHPKRLQALEEELTHQKTQVFQAISRKH